MPVADPEPRRHHGHEFLDRHEWLRDRDDPAVLAHLEGENTRTEEATAHLEELRDTLFDEIRSRTRETDLSVPVRDGDWWYFSRTREGAEYRVHCRAPASSPQDWEPPVVHEDGVPGPPLPHEEVLLDENLEADGAAFFELGSFDISEDGERLLFAVDRRGDERYLLRVRDLATGTDQGPPIPDTAAGAVFGPGGDVIYYTTVDDAWRPDTVWRLPVGAAAERAERVFHEPDERFWVGVGVSRSRRFVEIEIASKVTTEVLLVDAAGAAHLVWPRREGVEYSAEHVVVAGEDRLFITHNAFCPDFSVSSVPLTATGDGPREEDEVLPGRPGVRIEEVTAFADFLTVEHRRDGVQRVSVSPLTPGHWTLTEVPVEEELFTLTLSGNADPRAPRVRLRHTSLVTPPTVLEVRPDLSESGDRGFARTVLKRQPVLGGYDPAHYRQRRDWAVAEDGRRVPISLVWRGAPGEETPDGPAPLLLYGYGAYEISIDPEFSIPRLSLLDRGVVFAIAHVRGGGEMGRSWYEEGRLLRKPTTFTDFIAVARHLTRTGWTSPDRIVAEGGSAGGLLMGAVANLAPEEFAGILADVPFVDPLTSILDPSLPLTVIEWDEWGNPVDDPAAYAVIRDYSPYENVRDGAPYPRILALAGLEDTRVLYVEPAKWVARLREGGAPVLLRTEMTAGHGGASGRYQAWRERAFSLAWILDVLGLSGADDQRGEPGSGSVLSSSTKA